MKTDTRYPRIKRISVYDDEVSAYYLIARSGERVVIENRAAKEKKFKEIAKINKRSQKR